MYRVLIVDEDGEAWGLIARALSSKGYGSERVSRGEDALQRLSEGGVDVLISEAHLPDMPAWDFLPRVHTLDRDIPAIVVTADDTWETSRRVRIEGGPVFFYGLKPLDVREITQVVQSAAQWRQKQRSGPGEEMKPEA